MSLSPASTLRFIIKRFEPPPVNCYLCPLSFQVSEASGCNYCKNMIINDSLISWHQYSQLLQQLLKYLRRRLSMNARDTKLYPLNMKCSGLFLWILFNLHSKSSKSPFDRKTNCLCSLLQQLSVGLAGVTQGRTLLGNWNDYKNI